MTKIFAVVVYWCLASAPVDQFNPHQLDAAAKFVRANPATCTAELQVEPVSGPRDEDECRGWALLRYMPGWLQGHSGALYLSADCSEMRPGEPLDMEAAKRRVTP